VVSGVGQDANFAGLLADADRPSSTSSLTGCARTTCASKDASCPPSTSRMRRSAPAGTARCTSSASPDGHLPATASEASVVQLQDLADPALPVLDEVTAGPSWISTALFHPGRPLLATAGSDAAVRSRGLAAGLVGGGPPGRPAGPTRSRPRGWSAVRPGCGCALATQRHEAVLRG
jgi:hypothetical protein